MFKKSNRNFRSKNTNDGEINIDDNEETESAHRVVVVKTENAAKLEKKSGAPASTTTTSSILSFDLTEEDGSFANSLFCFDFYSNTLTWRVRIVL